MRTLVLAALCLSASAGHAEPQFPTPTLVVAPKDAAVATRAFALSPDGTRLAYIEVARWVARGAGTLKVIAIPTGQEQASLAAVPYDLEGLHWVSSDRLVLVERAGARFTARSMPVAGPLPDERLGPADRIAVAPVDGSPHLITYNKRTRRNQVTHEIAAYDPATLKQVKTATVDEAGGFVQHPDGKIIPLWWIDGWTTLVGRRPGVYDAKQDIRLPHQIVRLDVFARTIEASPLPVDGFARVTAEQRARPGLRSFVFPFRNAMRLVSGAEMRTITLARAAADYYAGSFHQQPVAGGRLLFSATSRKTRKDPDGVELYVVDLAAGEPKQLTILAGRQTFIEWAHAGDKLVLLRKRQGARTASGLEIYDVKLP